MLGLIVCSAVLGANPPSNPPESYAEARASASRSPADQVRLALWCEAHGLPAERLHHLSLAVLAEPTNATARGLMGLVAKDGRWLRPETVAERFRAARAGRVRDSPARSHQYRGEPVSARRLVRRARPQGSGSGSPDRRDPARPDAGRRLETSRLQQAWRPMGHRCPA